MLAIIIPYYKLNFFEKTLISVENQTDKRFNLYIGNDASPNNPSEIIQKTLRNTKYKYFEYQNNLGGNNLVKQWERVISEIGDEEWFMILGDDDMLSENFVEEFYNNIEIAKKNKCNVIKFSQCFVDDEGNKINEPTKYPNLIDPGKNLNNKLFKSHRSSLSEHIFNINSYKKIGFKSYPLAWGTDDIAVFEFSENNFIFFISNANVFIRMSDYNISGRSDNEYDKLTATLEFEKYLLKNYYKIIDRSRIVDLINKHIYYKYKQNIPLNINLFKIYFYLKKYRNILALPKTYIILMKKNK